MAKKAIKYNVKFVKIVFSGQLYVSESINFLIYIVIKNICYVFLNFIIFLSLFNPLIIKYESVGLCSCNVILQQCNFVMSELQIAFIFNITNM